MTGAFARARAPKSRPRSAALFFYAGFADKYDGAVHATQTRFVTLAMNEPWGVMGIVCPDEAPLLALRLAGRAGDRDGQRGRRRALSAAHPLAATDFYHVLDTSRCARRRRQYRHRRGATRSRKTLAEHDGVDALWHAGPPRARRAVEAASAGNLKATWTLGEGGRLASRPQGREFLRRATQVKNIWTPYGE